MLLIIADDLTGAADCAARCCGVGLPASVLLDGGIRDWGLGTGSRTSAPPIPQSPTPDPQSPTPDPQFPPIVHRPSSIVVSCTSDSRHLPPDAAARRVAESVDLVRPLAAGRSVRWYKKIDSTLRGNLGAELDAMLAAVGAPCAVVCPAFPAQGRGLRAGALVAPTVAGAGAHLPTLLREQSAHQVAAVDLATVREGVGPLAEALAAAHSSGAVLLVVDALSDDDLRTLLKAVDLTLPNALLCGSAGLVGALAEGMPHPQEPPAPRPPAVGPALFVIGSGSPMAHRQIAFLREQTECKAWEVGGTRDWGQGTGSRASRSPDPQSPIPDPQSPLLLHQSAPPPGTALDGPEARRRAEVLATAALDLVHEFQPGLLVLVGGDTAGAVLRHLGVQRLTILRELLPGMPLAWAEDAGGGGRSIVLKAGNHGDESTLVELLRALTNKTH